MGNSSRMVDRRKRTDMGHRMFILLSIFSWVVFIAGLVIFHRAQPEFVTVFDRFYHLKLRTQWDYQYVTYMFYTIAGGFFASLINLLLARIRARRRTDYKGNVIFLGCLYGIMIVLTVMIFLRGNF